MLWEDSPQIMDLSSYHKFQRWYRLSGRTAARNMKKSKGPGLSRHQAVSE